MYVRGERAKLHLPDPGVVVGAAPVAQVEKGPIIGNAVCPKEGGGCAALYVFVRELDDMPLNPQWSTLLVDVRLRNEDEQGGDGLLTFDMSRGGRVTLPAAQSVTVSARLRGTGGPTVIADFLLQWEQSPSGVSALMSGDRTTLAGAGTVTADVPAMARSVFWLSTDPTTLATAVVKMLSSSGLVLYETTNGNNALPIVCGASSVSIDVTGACSLTPVFEGYPA